MGLLAYLVAGVIVGGLVWALRGEPKVAFAFTIDEDGHVTGIEQLADPATLAALEIEFV